MSGSHAVVAGETLSGIAEKYGLRLNDLVMWNGIENPALIKVGQKIELSARGSGSGGAEYKVAPGDTFSAIGKKFGVNYREIMKLNGYADPTKLQVGAVLAIPHK